MRKLAFLQSKPYGDIIHDKKVEQETQLKMANAKKRWLIDYQQEREKKREYCR
jgi:hypothetical protein